MWFVWAIGCFIMAVAAHAFAVRYETRRRSVFKFLLIGTVFGFMLSGLMLAGYGAVPATLASFALYAFACELYVFLFTMVLASVSAKLLITLRVTAVSETQISELYRAEDMVGRRIERLLASQLLKRDGNQWGLTPKGLRLTKAFIGIKRFCGHST